MVKGGQIYGQRWTDLWSKHGRLINMSTFSYTLKKYPLPFEYNIMIKKEYPEQFNPTNELRLVTP